MTSGSVATVAVLCVLALFEITPIKISPLTWLGNRINKQLLDKIDTIQTDLQEHIADDYRNCILDFQNSCLNKRKHTKEEFTRVYKMCDKYEEYIKDRGLKNSEADLAIKYIKHVYETQLQTGEFLLDD